LRFVIDASVAVEYLLRTALGRRVAPRVEEAELLAPELLDAEVLVVLRRAHLAGRLPEARAREAVLDLGDWPVRRLGHRQLLPLAWSFRKNLSAYDALYVAAAKLHRTHLLTADGPLSRAPHIGVVIENVRTR
jgi:predicted nucleic acid-binding protein